MITNKKKQLGISKPTNSLLESKIRRIVRKVLKEETKESYYQEGDTVTFKLKGFTYDDFEDSYADINEKTFNSLNGKKCKILELETYTELGDKDHEYYNVKFPNGIELEAISGYHLD